jgi:Sulfatase-modifying factor enzyme 1
VSLTRGGLWSVPLFRLSLPLSLVAGCQDEPRVPVRPVRPLEVIPAQPVLECRSDPVSLPDAEVPLSGQDMCYSAAGPELWWMRIAAPADAGRGPEQAAPVDAAAPPIIPSACPDEMVLVEGDYCPNVRQRCLSYLDEGTTFLAKNRCKQFDEHPECLSSEREHRRFCIDRDEYVAPGAELPLVDQSWSTTRELCESLGKRLCFESEWVFACEGERMLPYPYGFARNAKLCNHDLSNLSDKRGKMRDLRVRPDSRPDCTSPFGVRNMVGNVDEWAYRDGFIKPWRAALKGGWWLAGRNNCRAATTGHDEYYNGPQTGVRCCANAH